MLHIILLILKIIGWILLAILGLGVLLICVVLLAPLCYRVNADCEGDLDSLYVNARFSWLFHLFRGTISYDGRKLDWDIRIAWRKMGQDPGEKKTPSEKNKTSEEVRTEKYHTKKKEEKPETEQEQKEDDISGKAVFETPHRERKDSYSFYQKIKYTIYTICDKIKQTMQKICNTMKSLLEKKGKLAEFITNEAHKTALSACLTELGRLLRFLKPGKLKLSLHFGFEDPSTTGYALAAGSMLLPFLGKHTNIQPDFEQEILEGDLFIAGKIRAIYFVLSLWNLIWNKSVRITFRHIKNIKTWISN